MCMQASENLEIERKYIIEIPPAEIMMAERCYTSSEILQIYLISPSGVTRRIRSRKYESCTRYFETSKIRIDRLASHEYEREIEREEFEALAKERAEDSRPILKTRHTFDYLGRTFEIDVYPEWEHSCIMEIELPSRDTEVTLPDFIRVVVEVTGDKRYSNAAMARAFPAEININEKGEPIF